MKRRRGTHSTSQATSVGLRVFDVALGILLVALTLLTALILVMMVAVITGSGSISVPVEVSPPYTIGFSGGRSIEIANGNASFENFEFTEDPGRISDLSMRGDVVLDRDDTDARIVAAGLAVLWTALCWLALLNVRRVVKSAREGEPFAARNAARVRWVAGTVLVVPIITPVGTWLLDRTVDSNPAVRVVPSLPAAWWMLVLGFGLLALAEVFRQGAQLRDLERATI